MSNDVIDVRNDTISVTTKQLVEDHQAAQKRKRTSARGCGFGSKTSIWSTIASKVSRNESDAWFVCKVCSYRGQTNKSFFTNRVIKHYKSAYNYLRWKLLSLNKNRPTTI